MPIQIEAGHPSTSTPNEGRSRTQAVPVRLVGVSENGSSTPYRKPRMHTPVRPVIHAVIDDDDDEPEVHTSLLCYTFQLSLLNNVIVTLL